MDTAGKLINFHVTRSNETPAYLALLSRWPGLLAGHQLFGPKPFADVDAVTGATVSSKAILSALQRSGRRFAAQILGQPLKAGLKDRPHLASYLPDTHGMYLIGAFVLTLIVIYRGGFWARLVVLSFNLLVGGIILNAQYSSEQIATILSLHSPAVGLTGAFLLVVGIPVLVVIFGNVYCGYICPFGAAQELLGYVVPDRFKQPIPAEKMQKARFIKYVVLFVLIAVFFFSRNRTTLVADPLIEIFSLRFIRFADDFQLALADLMSPGLLIVVIALVGSVFYARFWCRYLCPVGAFLSLLNSVVPGRRYLPVKRFDRCQFGLTAKDRMDCLYCNRCRYPSLVSRATSREPRATRYLLVVVLVAGAFTSVVSVRRFLQVVPAGASYPAISVSSAGQPRDVDLQRIGTMIQQKRLSDKEAQFYKKVE